MAEPCMAADDAMHSKSSVVDVIWEQFITEKPSFSSGDLTRIHEKIKSVFSKIPNYTSAILQFWTPVTIDGRRLLSTDGQPFAFIKDEVGLHKYRKRSAEYFYDIDVTYKQVDINEEVNPMIIYGSPAASAFLNHMPLVVDIEKGSPLSSYAMDCGLKSSCMLPVSWPSQNGPCCSGVVECSIAVHWTSTFELVNKALQEGGLSIFQVQEHIPYQIIGGLKHMRDHIGEALKNIVCESNNIALAQVWIPAQNDSQTKDKFTIKLTGYCSKEGYFKRFYLLHKYYNDFCDMFPLKIGEEFVRKTIQDYKPRFCRRCDDDKLLPSFFLFTTCSRLAICLRSTNTGRFDYVFEFIWLSRNNYIILLKALLLALKRYLPSFKVASGAELDAEFHVTDFENSTTSEIKFEEILPQNIQSPISAYIKYPQQHLLKEKPMVDKCVAPSETTPWHLLPREVTQQPFGNTIKEATENCNGTNIVEELAMIIEECSVKDVENSKTSEIEFVEISSPNSSYMNYLQQPVKEIQTVDTYVASSERTCMTTLTLLPREQQFGNIVEEATPKRNEPGDGGEKILQENILLPVLEALERGKKPMRENYIAHSTRENKTAPILLDQEAIEHQYGNTMKEAAKNLNVSVSTLKRKCKVFGISEWKGPNPAKRKVNNSCNQSYKNEDYEGAVQDPSAINKIENTLTIQAEYADDIIKFHLGISEATYITVEEEIGKKFKLTHGSYKLKYLDEDKDWILLASDQDMSDCINSSRNLGRIVVRLRVLPSTQPISG